MDIEKIRKQAAYIESFHECYKGIELWGVVEGPVPANKLLEFMIENPHFQEIANKIYEAGK